MCVWNLLFPRLRVESKKYHGGTHSDPPLSKSTTLLRKHVVSFAGEAPGASRPRCREPFSAKGACVLTCSSQDKAEDKWNKEVLIITCGASCFVLFCFLCVSLCLPFLSSLLFGG